MEAVASNSKSTTLPSSNFDVDATEPTMKDKQKDSGGIWQCSYCDLGERYDYKGMKPPFAKHLTYSEECYIMKDPFSPPNRNKVLVLGGDCSICKKAVCQKCSLFYFKRFCKNCASNNIQRFPLKLQERIILFNEENSEEM